MRVNLTVLAMVVVVTGCKKADVPAPPDQQQAGPQAAQPTTWKVQPTPLSIIKADPPSYVEKPTLVFVAIKPSDYFNYGYQNARNSHFAFEMRPALEGGRIGPDKLYGYAERSWARPFFERLTKQLGRGKYEYAAATLVVAYKKKRYDGQTADHIEILAAEGGERFDMDPADVLKAGNPGVARSGIDWSSMDFAGYMKREHFTGMTVRVVTADVVSEGTTKGLPSAVLKVNYTVESTIQGMGTLHYRYCSYFHVSWNADWKEFQSIVWSYISDPRKSARCSVTSPAYGTRTPFQSAVERLGYSGSLPTNESATNAPPPGPAPASGKSI